MLKFFSGLATKKVEEMKLKSNEGKELKRGARVYAKVLKSNGNKYLLSLNGDTILAKSERALEDGQVVKLKIERVTDKNELIVKLDEEIPKASVMNIDPKDELLRIKREILKLSIEEKVYLTNNEVEELVEGLGKFHKRGNEIEADLVKALIVMKKLHIADEETFLGLRKFYSKEIEKNIEVSSIKEGIEEFIEYLKEDKSSYAKGLNRVNELSEKQGIINLLLGIKEFSEPIQVQLKKEGLGGEFSKDTINIHLKLELDRLGKFEVILNIWKKRVNLSFMFYDEYDKGAFKYLEKLKTSIERLGYIVEEIHLGRKAEEKVGEIGNINYKI